MDILTILKIVSIVLGVLTASIIPLTVKLVKAIKARKAAKTEAEKEAAKNDMLNAVNGFIVSAEELYKNIDDIVKAKGGSTGVNKKDSVMSKLQAYALGKGYSFDEGYWSNTVDEIVAMTRKVNGK